MGNERSRSWQIGHLGKSKAPTNTVVSEGSLCFTGETLLLWPHLLEKTERPRQLKYSL